MNSSILGASNVGSSLTEDCSLHLFCGVVCHSDQCTVYRPKSIQGLIIGLGNVGTYLLEDSNQAYVYLSRDGGYSWKKIQSLQGSFSFEIGLHSSIIIAVQNRMPTTEMYYSLNQGISWESIKIAKFPFHVSELIVESQSTKFLLTTGETKEYDKITGATHIGESLLINIDITTIGKARACENPPKPEKSDSDYEI